MALRSRIVGSGAEYGGISVRDKGDQSRLSFVLAKGLPYFSTTNEQHVTFVTFRQGSSGEALLEHGDATGNAQVRVGVTSDGCGKVETFPERPVRMMGGLPSFIMGSGC